MADTDKIADNRNQQFYAFLCTAECQRLKMVYLCPRVYVSRLYTAAAARHYERDISVFVVLLLLCFYWLLTIPPPAVMVGGGMSFPSCIPTRTKNLTSGFFTPAYDMRPSEGGSENRTNMVMLEDFVIMC